MNPLTSVMNSFPLSHSSKRGRAQHNTLQVPSCLVDGCTADLSKCREYHQRHKVCEAHSKTCAVTIGGKGQRFCQQCSRFHSLEAFDDCKRSCRKRLDKHNQRRRKPQSQSAPFDSSKYNPSHQGSKLISFESQYFPSNDDASSSWNDAGKARNNNLYTSHSLQSLKTNNFSSSFPQGLREKPFPFSQVTDESLGHLSKPHPNDSSSKFGDASTRSSNHKLLCPDGFDRVFIDSERASSLLSSSHPNTCGFNPMPFVHDVLEMKSDAAIGSSSLVAHSRSNKNVIMDCPGSIHHGYDPQTISFSWE